MSSVLDKRLILVVGKGGVGRSTVAASVAAAVARRGRKTLLFQSSAKDRFGAFFGKSRPVSTDIAPLGPNLFGINTTPAAAIEEYGLMVLKFRQVYKMVFENRVTKYFLRAIPGLEEYAVLGKAWFHTTEQERGRDKWDTLVFDMPASGHSLSMLRVPWAISDAVPEGPLTRDAHKVRELLIDPRRTAVLMVTLAEDMPVNEAIELREAFRKHLELGVTQLIVNQLYPDLFPEPSPQASVLRALEEDAPGEALQALRDEGIYARTRRALNREHIERLARELPTPQIHLPRLFVPAMGPAEIQALSKELESALA